VYDVPEWTIFSSSIFIPVKISMPGGFGRE